MEIVQDRLAELKVVTNQGYGVVPITNAWTMRRDDTSMIIAGGVAHEIDTMDLDQDFSLASMCKKKMSAKKTNPPSPTLPTKAEIKKHSLVCYQIGFLNGRQAIFQGLGVAKTGESIANFVGTVVVLAQDDGIELGVLRGFEVIPDLVGRLPEVGFFPILRRAKETEIECMRGAKRAEEKKVLALARKILRQRPGLAAGMEIEEAEFQFDHNKLILFAKMRTWLNFTPYVMALRTALENEFDVHSRVFIQRRFASV
jgi:hypothetical protein